MKETSTATPTHPKLAVFGQLCNLIPTHLVAQPARDTGVEEKIRSFKPRSHVVSLRFPQFSHAIGRNNGCDALRQHSGAFSAIGGATPPSGNGLSTGIRAGEIVLLDNV